MKLSDLEVFNAVVEEGSVTRAAARLHRVQSNVTTRIKQLEDNLGVTLFVREGKRLRLSSQGRILREYSGRILDLADEARTAVTAHQPGGVLRLGAMDSTAVVRLPGPIAELHKRFPEISLELRTGNPRQLSAFLLEGTVDAALIAGPVADNLLAKSKIYDEEIVIVTLDAHPKINDRNGLPKTIIVFESGCPHRNLLESWYQERGEIPARTIELGSYHAILSCVIAGMGAALLPKSVLSTFPEAQRLKVHALPKGRNRLSTNLAWRRGGESANLTALKSVLK